MNDDDWTELEDGEHKSYDIGFWFMVIAGCTVWAVLIYHLVWGK